MKLLLYHCVAVYYLHIRSAATCEFVYCAGVSKLFQQPVNATFCPPFVPKFIHQLRRFQARSQPTVPRGAARFQGGQTRRTHPQCGTGHGGSLEGYFGKEIYYAPP